MKPRNAAALVCAICLAGGAAWAFVRTRPEVRQPQSIASRPVSPAGGPMHRLPPGNQEGRTFLSEAQNRQALAAGTLDRPVRSLLRVSSPMGFGDYVWNDKAVPAGPTWIRVDLRSQLISVFRGGDEIGTSVIVYGGDNKETPVGKLHILAKARDHRSSLYDAQMPYTLRLTGDGVSIHGSSVRFGAATHGCIGVPLGFARRMFDAARVGDEVVIIPARQSNA